jgi:hypothetical protein
LQFRFRYRLRTLLLAIAALALPLRWWGVHANHDRQFGERIAAIEKYGGQVEFGFSEGSPSFDEKLWLFLGGDDRLGRPAHVWISKGNLNEEQLLQLDIGGFPNLEDLLLDGCSVGDRSTAALTEARNLKGLSLARTHVTDASLKTIGRFTQLEEVDFLTGTAVTDCGLRSLAKLHHLEVVSLRDTNVTRAGLAELRAALPETLINHNVEH